MYAVLDIETTGGQFNEEGITEIAIYRFDGHEVTDQFISLVNPEIPIQPFVVKLTGINNAMLKSAPRFFEVAKRIIEITDGCVLVAHNASFDHRILRTEFRRLGYDFQIKTLCTVELAQKLIPEQPSYSLGKLVRALGIPIADRHRANGDAMATLKLFRMLLEKDLEKTIVMELIKTEIEKGIEPRLVDIIADVPSKAGIYYVHNEAGDIIFIAKSKNIKKHLNQHFTGTARISKKIQAEVFRVTHEETGSELIAALKEVEEIRIHKPIYNSLRKKALQWGIYPEADVNGYLKLSFRKAELRKKEPTLFVSEHEGRNVISRVAADYKLCQKFTGQFEGEGHCPSFEKEKCEGACGGNITPEDYNAHVAAILERTNIDARNLMLIDRGRTLNERSAILIEDGICKGYAFFDLNYQLNNIDILRNILVPMPNQRDTSALIRAHLVKNKRIKIVSF